MAKIMYCGTLEYCGTRPFLRCQGKILHVMQQRIGSLLSAVLPRGPRPCESLMPQRSGAIRSPRCRAGSTRPCPGS